MERTTICPDECASIAREIFGKKGYLNKTTHALDKEICSSLIGTSYSVCSELWNLMELSNKEGTKGAKPKHLFWALLFLKCYCTEAILTRVVGGVDEKTFRKWTWLFVGSIAELKPRVVSVVIDCSNFLCPFLTLPSRSFGETASEAGMAKLFVLYP